MKRCILEDPDGDGHPIASLDMGLVKRVTKKLSPVDFLKDLEHPLHLQKRKRGSGAVGEGSKRRTKKIKLN